MFKERQDKRFKSKDLLLNLNSSLDEVKSPRDHIKNGGYQTNSPRNKNSLQNTDN